MLTRALTALALFALTLLVPDQASAISPTCLPGGFPSTPTPPVVGKDITWVYPQETQSFHIDVWRVPCQDGSGQVALLLRVTPITIEVGICFGNFKFIQGGEQIAVIAFVASGNLLCASFLVPVTASLEAWPGQPPFDNTAAFTLDVNQLSPSFHTQLEIPALDTGPPTPHIGLTATTVSGAVLDWAIAGFADFNGDGKADVLWRHPSGLVHIWLMDGGQILSSSGVSALGNNWQIEGVADFDGDGKADILWHDTVTGTVAVWFMDGATLRVGVAMASMPAEWVIAGVGDLDGDGRADILWRHTPSGAVAFWITDIVLE